MPTRCDNWISTVYGPARTLRLPNVEVNHLITRTRYDVISTTKDNAGKATSVPGMVMPDELVRGACTIDRWLLDAGHASKPKTKQTGSGAPAMNGKDDPKARPACVPTTRKRGEYPKPGTRTCVGTVTVGVHRGKTCDTAWGIVRKESGSDSKADEWCGKVCTLGPENSRLAG